MQQVEGALETYRQLGNTGRQAGCLIDFARMLCKDKQFNAAEEAAFRATDLLPEEGKQYQVCQSHRLLGKIYHSEDDTGKAIHHFELALGIASPFKWHDVLFWVHYRLAWMFHDEGRLDDVNDHIERAKSHAVDSAYNLGLAMEEQARLWHK
jgi:tetratricopeptide (TPR) repeat protein